MRKLCIILILLFTCCLPACSPETIPEDTGSAAAPPEANIEYLYETALDIDKDTLPFSDEELYEQLFDAENKIEIHMDITDTELAKLQADYEKNRKSPIYRKANMLITIIHEDTPTTYLIRDVGVRMKGNTSRTDFYNDTEGIYNAIHLKIDFQETFDDEELYGAETHVWEKDDARDARKDRLFASMEKLEMRWNKCYDSTYLRESYAYELYRAYDVLAPLMNLCSFDFGGIHMGVYTINEPVDKLFLEKRLPEEATGGDLYKLGWTSEGATFTNGNSIGVENELKNEFYVYDLKTNKKSSKHAHLRTLIGFLNSKYLSKDVFAELVDVDNFLNYAAVSYFLGNPDDLRNNYNNCYLYFRKDNNKAIIIPYDYDRCLGITYEWNPTGDGFTTDNPFTEGRDGAEHQPATQENPLFLYSVSRGGFYVQEFADVLQEVAKSPLLLPETFEEHFLQAKSLYGANAKPDKELKNGNGRDWNFSLDATSGPNLSFEEYITAKLQSYNKHMGKLEEYVNYVRPKPVTHYVRGDFNDWSNHEDYAMKELVSVVFYSLNLPNGGKFKVYDNIDGVWYGIESLSTDTQVSYQTDNHGNLVLAPGKYLITFNTQTKLITISE